MRIAEFQRLTPRSPTSPAQESRTLAPRRHEFPLRTRRRSRHRRFLRRSEWLRLPLRRWFLLPPFLWTWQMLVYSPPPRERDARLPHPWTRARGQPSLPCVPPIPHPRGREPPPLLCSRTRQRVPAGEIRDSSPRKSMPLQGFRRARHANRRVVRAAAPLPVMPRRRMARPPEKLPHPVRESPQKLQKRIGRLPWFAKVDLAPVGSGVGTSKWILPVAGLADNPAADQTAECGPAHV